MRLRLPSACRVCAAAWLCAALALVARPAAAQVPPRTVVDVVFSTSAMERGADAVSAATSTIGRASDAAAATLFGNRFKTPGTRGAALRLLKLALLDAPVVHFADGLNHELGHMARASEVGMPLRFALVGGPWSAPQFDLSCPQPWRLGLGTFGGGFDAELLRESRLLDRASEENTRSLADAMTLLDGALGRLYYVQHDLAAIRGRASDDVTYDAGDPTRYVYELVERRLGYVDGAQVLATARSVRARSWLNLADAGLWAQALNVARYVVRGDDPRDPYWLRLRGVGLMPFTQYHLSPVGPQLEVGTRYRGSQDAGEVLVRWTEPIRGFRVLGSGLSWSRTSGRVVRPRVRFDVWRALDRSVGVRVEGGIVAARWPSARASLVAAAGAKSEGYVLGLPQQRATYAQAGLRLRF